MAKAQIMYIEYKGNGITGPGRIGRGTFSKASRTLNYRGIEFQSLAGAGYKANYYDVETGDHYWISGCRKDGEDSLYPSVIDVDADVQEEYWTLIRGLPANVGQTRFRSHGKHSFGGRETK